MHSVNHSTVTFDLKMILWLILIQILPPLYSGESHSLAERSDFTLCSDTFHNQKKIMFVKAEGRKAILQEIWGVLSWHASSCHTCLCLWVWNDTEVGTTKYRCPLSSQHSSRKESNPCRHKSLQMESILCKCSTCSAKSIQSDSLSNECHKTETFFLYKNSSICIRRNAFEPIYITPEVCVVIHYYGITHYTKLGEIPSSRHLYQSTNCV